jgi:hypothetical protein
LPSLDSISAASDIRSFLAAGVPTNLTRAALRRAWATDHSIRDFIGLSENSWDFNAPEGMSGFGALKAEDIDKLLTQATGQSDEATVAAESSAPHVAPHADDSASPVASVEAQPAVDAPHKTPSPDAIESGADTSRLALGFDAEMGLPIPDEAVTREPSAPSRRRHGGALPES